ncbi:MAG: vitamin K epoxide reductase family protein [Patescibacteria group bacterium]|nr:MAG: vitamin K epoxide reductase family protein [Patescibacteria group bacterium]
MIRKRATSLLLFFSVAGFLISGYALKQHYAPLGTSFCNVNDVLNCDLVNKGPYGEIYGFPVAAIGLIGYLMILIVSVQFLRTKDPVLGKAMLFLLAGGLAFSLYLTALEAFVIYAWCLICLGSLSSITGATLAGWMVYKQETPAAPVAPPQA